MRRSAPSHRAHFVWRFAPPVRFQSGFSDWVAAFALTCPAFPSPVPARVPTAFKAPDDCAACKRTFFINGLLCRRSRLCFCVGPKREGTPSLLAPRR